MPEQFDDPKTWALVVCIAGPLIAALLAFTHMAAHAQHDYMAGRELLGSNSRLTLAAFSFSIAILAFIYLLTQDNHFPDRWYRTPVMYALASFPTLFLIMTNCTLAGKAHQWPEETQALLASARRNLIAAGLMAIPMGIATYLILNRDIG